MTQKYLADRSQLNKISKEIFIFSRENKIKLKPSSVKF